MTVTESMALDGLDNRRSVLRVAGRPSVSEPEPVRQMPRRAASLRAVPSVARCCRVCKGQRVGLGTLPRVAPVRRLRLSRLDFKWLDVEHGQIRPVSAEELGCEANLLTCRSGPPSAVPDASVLRVLVIARGRDGANGSTCGLSGLNAAAGLFDSSESPIRWSADEARGAKAVPADIWLGSEEV